MPQRQKHKQEGVELVDYTRNADEKILCALLFHVSGRPYKDCRRQVKRMSGKEQLNLFKQSLENMELFDTVLREFECAQLTYALTVSAACFGQLKRHRLATLITQNYQPSLGTVIPPIVKTVGMERMFRDIIEHTETVYQRIEKKRCGIGAYVLTNAHQKRVLMSMNLRELYHISRLREDPTAQWDIRQKAQQMSSLARKVMPITTVLLGGKTEYPAVYRRLYDKKPRITSVPEP